MPLDADAKALMDAMLSAGPLPWDLPPVDARKQMEQAPKAPMPEVAVANIENRTIPGPDSEIPVGIYTPNGAAPASGHPVLVFFHGGGWVIGSLDSHDGQARARADLAKCVVVSVDYRLAPEDRFPAAAEDCYAAPQWARPQRGL